ncbi:DEAD/DEAH box helicase [Zhongshania guokunii]|uniref:DEAD/DEAH box helicase n=1 Tax=Zhongshania guokunii TaxID=641783 RepID=A0ABV3U495_9GAMM
MLRRWQSECVGKALDHFKGGQRHFFCQATPAAGKTRMSAELSKRMLETGMIDLVVCFAPSREVAQGFRATLESVVGGKFDGLLGACGTALTYQAMDYLSEDFWSLFYNYRVLAIFDEIHHCAAQEPGVSNLWGQLIVKRIQESAAYTVGLSGTPWRSDEMGIALARYSTPEGRLICDFRYSLANAVVEKVCRSPRIMLVDNGDVQLTVSNSGDCQVRTFESISSLLKDPVVSYQDLLVNEPALRHMLQLANNKLSELRGDIANAAGLVVASTIDHAYLVAEILNALGETAMVVASDSLDARNRIQRFREGNQRWIVAVGMVAEGTDIPRLQVCCHVSRIRTELHFRQVLGRILRRIGGIDKYAWMYIFAESSLSEFAKRVAEDLPHDLAVLPAVEPASVISVGAPIEISGSDSLVEEEAAYPLVSGEPESNETEFYFHRTARELAFSEHFRHQLLAIF